MADATAHNLDLLDPPDGFILLPDDLEPKVSQNTDTVESMSRDGTDPAAIVVSRRTLGWAAAAVLALFSGGQMVTVKFAGDGSEQVEGTDSSSPTLTQRVDALTNRVDSVSAKVDQLSADGVTRDARFTKILNAVLIWQLEQDRYYRETRQPGSPPRSQELEAASQRLRDLATDF